MSKIFAVGNPSYQYNKNNSYSHAGNNFTPQDYDIITLARNLYAQQQVGKGLLVLKNFSEIKY